MKKNIIYLLITLISIGLVACNVESEQLDTDTNDANLFVQSIYDKPDGPYIDFEFAIVYFNTGVENRPYKDYVDALWSDSNLDNGDWNYDNFSKVTNFPTIYLVYNTKESLLLDFERIKEIVSLTETVSVYLNTIDMEFTFSTESKVEDLKTVIGYYDGSEIEVEQLPFEQLLLSTDFALVNGYIVLDSFDAYIKFNPENILKLDEKYFIEKSVIFVGKDRSGSLEIRGIDRLFVSNEGVMEIAINGYSKSQHFTEDIQYWTSAISVDKSILEGIEAIVVHQHITFGNGYLSDVPFHNSKEKPN